MTRPLLDPRTTPLRDGIASQSLEGLVRAEVYLEPTVRVCAAAAASVHREPSLASEMLDELLFGEIFEVIEEDAGGFVWGQSRRDGYLGFVEVSALGGPPPEPTHRVAALRTYAFADASIKSRALNLYSMNALVAVETDDGRLSKVTGAGWITSAHLAPMGVFAQDAAAVAEQFLGAPYLWGGRQSLGLDCSGLIQAALHACGQACPRDTDQQEGLGTAVAQTEFGRGDLVFWKGHVAMGLDEAGLEGGRIVHASGHHMAVVIEPLETAIRRIEAAGSGAPTSFRRLPRV